jgi:ribulose-phosphate 3-epimerase
MSLKPNSDWFDTLPRERLMAEYSLWSADLANLEADILRVDQFVDLYHADAADGRFAPSFLMFPDQIARIRKVTAKPIHVHLMIEGDILLSQIRQFAEAGADLISFHPETGDVTSAGLDLIAELGVKAGLVLRLETPVSALAPYVSRLDFVTLLGTAIGVKGQSLSETACPRLKEAGALIAASGRDNAVLAADGGIRETTVPLLRQAGAQTVVMGSLAFNDPDLPARMAWLRAL